MGDERLNAQADNKIKHVVGSNGRKTPITPSANDMLPNIFNAIFFIDLVLGCDHYPIAMQSAPDTMISKTYYF